MSDNTHASEYEPSTCIVRHQFEFFPPLPFKLNFRLCNVGDYGVKFHSLIRSTLTSDCETGCMLKVDSPCRTLQIGTISQDKLLNMVTLFISVKCVTL